MVTRRGHCYFDLILCFLHRFRVSFSARKIIHYSFTNNKALRVTIKSTIHIVGVFFKSVLNILFYVIVYHKYCALGFLIGWLNHGYQSCLQVFWTIQAVKHKILLQIQFSILFDSNIPFSTCMNFVSCRLLTIKCFGKMFFYYKTSEKYLPF